MLMREKGIVTDIVTEREGLQIVSVLMQRSGVEQQAVHYTEGSPLLRVGDTVELNVTAEELGLGSGGYHLVMSVMNNAEQLPADSALPARGHIVKLKYTPFQRSVLAVEEACSPYHAIFQKEVSLESMPVLLGELHSMLPVAMCWLRYRERQDNRQAARTAYVMTDGGALPLAWSTHVALLERMGWLASTITYGQAYGGKLEAVNKFSALISAKHVVHADLALVTMGPGIVGTGTRYGYSGIEIGELVNAVHALGGIPIVIPRLSFADRRSRHVGLSHHTLTALQLAAACPAAVPLPLLEGEQADVIGRQAQQLERHLVKMMPAAAGSEIAGALSDYPQPITSMGRGLFEDPAYFQGICAAVDYALRLHSPSG
ncbi:DUF3866 family protein [Paenibacillus sp. GCM10023248]|uniref:DUF3866 family protein n=1 Tax=unclassified Paenibacillus TaxID=185978 RepID=UPI002377D63A|nr:DUF3866 family protein [Paenibacillus sp. MAHUQ-63]MDD9267555.1 DUF3866 family protein [Paenibacillus sp. MAHUQ-63]